MDNLTIKTKLERKIEVFEKFISVNSMEGVYRNALLNVIIGLKADMNNAKNEKDLNTFKNTIDSHFEDFVKNMIKINDDRDHFKVRYYNS